MSKYSQGKFTPRNPEKYVGVRQMTYRSSWELAFAHFCDQNENILQWASEPVRIPYRHPLTGKMTIYVPDFIVTYRSPNNTVRAELIEIKPKNQSLVESRMNTNQRAVVAVNYCKWDSATKWAKRNGLTFRVINENAIFHQGSKNK